MEYLKEIFALGIDAIVFTICLKEYIYYQNALQAIKGVELHDVGSDLRNLLDNSPNNKVDYIAIKGVVKPLGESLQSINKTDITGVIQNLNISEHIVAKTSTGFWSGKKRIIQQICQVVPFALQKGQYSVEIKDPLSADILNLDIISDQYQPSIPIIVNEWGSLTRVCQSGIHSTEKMLRKGSIITAIGELLRSEAKSDSLILQPPLNGPPFCITNMSITALIQKLDEERQISRVFCLMSAASGLLLVGIMARRYWKNKQERK